MQVAEIVPVTIPPAKWCIESLAQKILRIFLQNVPDIGHGQSLHGKDASQFLHVICRRALNYLYTRSNHVLVQSTQFQTIISEFREILMTKVRQKYKVNGQVLSKRSDHSGSLLELTVSKAEPVLSPRVFEV